MSLSRSLGRMRPKICSITRRKPLGSRSLDMWWVSSWVKVRSTTPLPTKMPEGDRAGASSMSMSGNGVTKEKPL